MKKLIFIALLLLTIPYTHAQMPSGLPQIGVTKTIKFSPTYSCRSHEEFKRNGYEGVALFLTDEMKQRNSPDLVFNGACGSENYFKANPHGGNYSMVVDLGMGATITPQISSIITTGEWRDSKVLEMLGFKGRAPVISGHTYAVLLNKHGVLGLFVFTVTDFAPDRYAAISYEVLDYQIPPEKKGGQSSTTKKNSQH